MARYNLCDELTDHQAQLQGVRAKIALAVGFESVPRQTPRQADSTRVSKLAR